MEEKDFIVVGGGVSGLLSALALGKEGEDVLLLEKEDYLGGVCRSYKVDGYQVDTGPHMITRVAQGPLKYLIDNYFDIIPNFMPHGKYYVVLNNRVKPFPWNMRDWVSFDLLPQTDRMYLMKTLFSISYLFNKGEDLSKKSVADFIGNGLSEPTIRFLNCMSYFMTGAPMDKTPVERFVDAEHYKSQSRGLLDKIYNILMKEGAQDQVYPKGGIQSIITSIKASIPQKKVELRTGEEVVAINPAEKTIESSSGEYRYNTLIYSGFTSDLPKLTENKLPEEYTKSLSKLHKINALTLWLGLNSKIFNRNGSEIWVDSDPYTWAVPVSNYDPNLSPKGKQLVGFAFSLPPGFNEKKEKKRSLEAIYEMNPKIERNVDMIHYQMLIPEKAVWTIDTLFANVKTPVEGIYLVGTDTERRSMGITRASYSVNTLLSTLREDKRL
ncbi:MAG: NAD(P)/FAD-dependent oxidoreductase [Candidatus Altiarchaeota archaeon]|nr:NAD(P)/FAD-dependent oxidoreductase [Candidatus Altiarchaeota archaeon]